MSDRVEWVDRAKGIGIILVVAAHNLGGQRNAGLPVPPIIDFVNTYAYTFHMPLFFFLSGLFVQQSLRKGVAPFLKSKVATIFYPFVLWSVIQGTIQGLLGSYVNHSVGAVHALLLLFVQPIGQLWFLYALFFMFLVFAGAAAARVPTAVMYILPLVTVVAASHVSNSFLHKLLNDFLFFAAGAWLRAPVKTFLANTASIRLGILGVFALALQITLAFQYLHIPFTIYVADLTALAGILSVLAVSELLARSGRGNWILLVGQYSFAIFLMHTIVGAGIRIVAAHLLHITHPWFHAAAELGGGVLIPMAVAYGCTQVGWKWPFEWPIKPRLKTDYLAMDAAK